MIVHSISHATYQAARALRDYVHATIGVSPRIRDDLISRYAFKPSRTHAIFDAVDPKSIADPNSPRPLNAVLSLGRLENASKGILQLPQVYDRDIAKFGTLSIAGDGPDRERLVKACAAAGLQPNWLGTVPPDKVADVYAKHAIFLFPSRFEGMGLALAEAMASGLVPIAARIRNVTDTIIEDGVSGYLFDQRDLQTARARLLQLLQDSPQIDRMRQAAANRARRLFGLDDMANAYRAVLQNVVANPFPIRSLPIERWSIPYRMRPGLRALLPQPVRRRIGDMLLSMK
jgi:glycosyltransferase involved in cell wall biosynthesis